jgi:hypothetical protein
LREQNEDYEYEHTGLIQTDQNAKKNPNASRNNGIQVRANPAGTGFYFTKPG